MNNIILISKDGEEFEISKEIKNKIGILKNRNENSKFFLELDCLLLDEILRFLEFEEKNNNFYNFETNFYIKDLLTISIKLNIPLLEQYCYYKENNSLSRIKKFSYSEFLKHQTKDDFWLLIDGYIYDITKWINIDKKTGNIPHPGGISPLKIRNKDSTYYFEIYHKSEYSFKLLKKFFIGILNEEDKYLISGVDNQPSNEFLLYLRSFTKEFLK